MNRLLLLAVLLAPGSLPAQTAPGAPPKVLNMVHQRLVPGKEGKYATLLTSIARAYARAGTPVYWLQMPSITGPTESMSFNFLDSFEDAEKTYAALGQAMAKHPEWIPMQDQLLGFVSSATTVIAARNDELGNHADAIDFSKAKFLCVTKAANFFSTTGIESPWVVYEVGAGMPMPAFVIVQPLQSLKDAGAALTIAKTISSGTGESNLYAISPEQSHMPPGFVPAANDDKR